MHMPRRLFSGFLAACFGAATPVHAGIWEDVARTVVAPVTAPYEMTARVLQGRSPEDAVRAQLRAPGNVLATGSTLAGNLSTTVYSLPRDNIRRELGPGWVDAYDTLIANNRVQAQIASTSGRFLGGCMQGQPCNLQQLTAIPLAGAMRDAYQVYAPYSMPLHPQLIQALSSAVPMQVLTAARVSVGNVPNMTVPGLLNASHRTVGNAHAVTLGNVMIFSRHINFSNRDDLIWFLHELHHVEQYMRYSPDILESIDGFAADYIYHYNSIENQAENAAAQRINMLWRY